jgi:hypothetical protein
MLAGGRQVGADCLLFLAQEVVRVMELAVLRVQRMAAEAGALSEDDAGRIRLGGDVGQNPEGPVVGVRRECSGTSVVPG